MGRAERLAELSRAWGLPPWTGRNEAFSQERGLQAVVTRVESSSPVLRMQLQSTEYQSGGVRTQKKLTQAPESWGKFYTETILEWIGMNRNSKAPFFPTGDSDLENRKPTVDFCPSKHDKWPYTWWPNKLFSLVGFHFRNYTLSSDISHKTTYRVSSV